MADFLAGGDVGHAERAPAFDLDDIHQRHALMEQFAKDDAFGKARDGAKTDALGQVGHQTLDLALVFGIGEAQAIAHDDPVGGLGLSAVALGANHALLPHQLGVMTGALHGHGFGVNAGQHVQVDEAVVERRHQRVGKAVRQTRQLSVGTGGIHDQHVVAFGHVFHHALQQGFDPFGVAAAVFGAQRQQFWHGQVQLAIRDVAATVFEIAGNGALAGIQIGHRHATPRTQQGHGQVHHRGRLAAPALFIADDDDV